MPNRAATGSTIFIILLLVQANVAAADPVPSLGMPSDAQAHYDAATGTIEVTWGPPAGSDPNTTLTYEVRKDGHVVYMGASLSYVDASPHAVVVYAITAFAGSSHGVAAITVGSPIDIDSNYPHCVDLVQTSPPRIKEECIFPLP